MKKGVSVIICCYNSASRISETLEYLSKQKTPSDLKWEIVLVDNASTDNTSEIAAALWKKLGRSDIPLKIAVQPLLGLSFARAKGIETSAYSVLIFCDDDNWLQDNYLVDAYAILDSNLQIGALGGVGIATGSSPLPDWFNKYKFCFACYAQGEIDGELPTNTSSLYGAGLVIRRTVLDKLSSKNFRPILTDRKGSRLMSGGDTELCFAIHLAGYKLWFSAKLQFHHYLPPSRLTKKYLCRLNKSLAYCSGQLIIYRYILTGKSINQYTWLKDVSYQLISFCKSIIQFLIISKPSFDRKLYLAYSYNSLKSILFQFRRYKSRYEEIMKIRD